jgi:hypothetical protein
MAIEQYTTATPSVIVNVDASTSQTVPFASVHGTAVYQSGQQLSLTLMLNPGQQYAPQIGFSTLVLTTSGPVQLIASKGTNSQYINQTVNQTVTIDDTVDFFTLTNISATASISVSVLVTVAISNTTPAFSIVTSLNGKTGALQLLPGNGIAIDNTVTPITITNSGVVSLNGQTGAVLLNASNLPGLALVAQTGNYNDLNNKPTPYALPIASATVLGGIKVGTGLTIAGDGTLTANAATAVQTVSTVAPDVSGNVTVQTIDAQQFGGITAVSLISDSGTTTAIAKLKQLSAKGGITLQSVAVDSNGNSQSGPDDLIYIGTDGTFVHSVNNVTPTNGNVALTAANIPGLATVAKTGQYNDLLGAPQPYTLPTANLSTLGGVKIGAGVNVAGDGTISVTFPVTSINTLTGAVVIQAQNANGTSGTSLIADSGATTGTIKLRTIVPGTGVTFTADANSNIVINSAQYTLPAATGTTLGGVKAGANINVAPDGTISTANPYALPAATAGTLGGVKIGSGVSVASDGTISVVQSSYVLPTATSSILGGVKIGANVTVQPDGTISVPDPYALPAATGATLGGVKIGSNISVAGDGTISVMAPYTLPTASAGVLGGVKIGSGVNIAGDGTISVTPYTLPFATTLAVGGVKIGSNISVAGDGTISVAAPYTLPVATISTLGGVKQGTGVTIAGDGTISATQYTLPAATSTTLGGVKIGANISVSGDGTISVAGPYTLAPATTSTLGGVIVGSGLNVAVDGTISVSPYTLPIASGTTLGGVKIGSGINIAGDGTISVTSSSYTLPAATSTTLGGVKIGANVNVAGDGTISVAAPFNLQPASDVILGGVKIGSGVTVQSDGTISVAAYSLQPATSTTLGGVKIGANVNVAGDGTISVAGPYILPIASSTALGGVKVGSGLTIAGDGTLAVTGSVTSFNGRSGAVVLTLGDITAVGGAPLASPVFTGTPQGPTPTTNDNSTNLATTSYVQSNLANYAPIASPVLTGTPEGPTAAAGTNTQQLATTAFAVAQTSILTPRTVNSGTATIAATDAYIGVNNPGAVTLTLPSGSSVTNGKFFVVKDESGAAATNNITIIGNGTDKIDGQANVIINTNYGIVRLLWNTNLWSIV